MEETQIKNRMVIRVWRGSEREYITLYMHSTNDTYEELISRWTRFETTTDRWKTPAEQKKFARLFGQVAFENVMLLDTVMTVSGVRSEAALFGAGSMRADQNRFYSVVYRVYDKIDAQEAA